MQAVVYNISAPRWLTCKIAGLFSSRVYGSPFSGLRLQDVPEPTSPTAGWVKLQTIYGGVCGTDLALIAQRNHPATILQQYASFPAVLGHENVARIIEVGPGVSDWRVGERVVVDPALGCAGRGVHPPCANCAAGHTSICEAPGDKRLPPRALLGLNQQTLGSWAPFFNAHHTQLHRVPDEIADEIAILVDPVASAAHAVLRRPPQDGETILVQGAGIVALGLIAALRGLGLINRITSCVRNTFQADLATKMGATNVLRFSRNMSRADRFAAVAEDCSGTRMPGRIGNQSMLGGYDVVYDCSGRGEALSDALKWTRARGTCVVVGTNGIAVTDTTPIWFNEVNVIGANGRQVETLPDGRQRHSYDVVFDWLCDGRLDLSQLPTRCLPLREYRTGIRMLLQRPRPPLVKVYFRP